MSGAGSRSPLEVIHDVTEAVEQEVMPAGPRAARLSLQQRHRAARSGITQARSRYEALVEDRPTLRERLLDGLRSAGADVRDVDVNIAYPPQAGAGWSSPDFHVEFARATPALEIVEVNPPTRDPIDISILMGTASEPTYTLNLARIDIGRGVEVRDTRDLLLRTNHVAFTEGDDEVNRSRA